jgi:CubicO group peptidase (beta-lactamase class C family)
VTPQTIFDLASMGKQFYGNVYHGCLMNGVCLLMTILFPNSSLNFRLMLKKNHHQAFVESHCGAGRIRRIIYSRMIRLILIMKVNPTRQRGVLNPRQKDVLNLLSQQNLLRFIPGDDWEYSDAGYVILGQIVEKVSGKSLAHFMHDNIFKPTGMNNTILVDETKPKIPNLAVSYMPVGNELKGTNSNPLSLIYGDGNVNSSIEDLAKWYAALDNNTLVKLLH